MKKPGNDKIWEDSFYVNWHETDLSGAASPESICNFLGESAGRHADALGFGYDDAQQLKQFWVVLRWYVRMYRYPQWKETLVLQTWPRQPERFYAYRDYALKSTDGELLGAVTSTWMVLDSVTRRPESGVGRATAASHTRQARPGRKCCQGGDTRAFRQIRATTRKV